RALLGAGGGDHLGVELVIGLEDVVDGHALVGVLEFLGVGIHQRDLVVVAEVVPDREFIGSAAAGFGAGTTAATAAGQAQRQAEPAQGKRTLLDGVRHCNPLLKSGAIGRRGSACLTSLKPSETDFDTTVTCLTGSAKALDSFRFRILEER